MGSDQENVSRILSVLSHPLRREILIYLSERDAQSFTDLANTFNVDTGKLGFHIRSLAGFLEQTSSGKYGLSRIGENAVKIIKDVELWAVEANVSEKKSSFHFANLKRRTFAYMIDSVMSFAVFMVIVLVTNLLSSLSLANAFRFGVNDTILFLLVLWVYLTLLEGYEGQSLGKRIVGLRVIRVDDKKLFYDAAAVRNFGKVFLLPFDLLFGLRLRDERFVRYFDKFAGTTVVDLRFESSKNIALTAQ